MQCGYSQSLRMVKVMAQRVSRKLPFSRKLWLNLGAVAAIAAPVFFAW